MFAGPNCSGTPLLKRVGSPAAEQRGSWPLTHHPWQCAGPVREAGHALTSVQQTSNCLVCNMFIVSLSDLYWLLGSLLL